MKPNFSRQKRHRLYYQQAIREIEQKKFSPIYLVYGEEILLGDNLIHCFKENFLENIEPELNFFVRYATEGGIDPILNLVGGMSLFSDKKLIVLKEAEALKQNDIDKLIQYLKKPASEICLILHTTLTSLYQSRLKKIEEYVTLINLLPLSSNDIQSFIKSEFRKRGKKVTSEAIDLIIFLVGIQLTDLMGQIEIIAQYYEDEDEINSKHIEQIVGIYVNQSVYELAMWIGRKNLNKSRFILHNLLEGGTSPQHIIYQLIRHFALLWRIKGYLRYGIQNKELIARELRIFPKYISEYVEQSKKWSSQSIKEVFTILQEADRRLKESGTLPEISLDILNHRIINC